MDKLKKELVEAARSCRASGLQTGNGGNLSVRVSGRELMLVKASEVSFGELEPYDLVLADFNGRPADEGGAKKPSRESRLHGAIYRVCPEVGAIVHCHSPWAVAWASTGRSLPEATYHAAIKLGGRLEVFDSKGYAVEPDFFPIILKSLAAKHRQAFLLKKHGQVALGRDLRSAVQTAELVEETAQIAVLSKFFNHE